MGCKFVRRKNAIATLNRCDPVTPRSIKRHTQPTQYRAYSMPNRPLPACQDSIQSAQYVICQLDQRLTGLRGWQIGQVRDRRTGMVQCQLARSLNAATIAYQG